MRKYRKKKLARNWEKLKSKVMNNTKPEMKNTLEIINIRITDAEELKENWKTKWQKSTAMDHKKKE